MSSLAKWAVMGGTVVVLLATSRRRDPQPWKPAAPIPMHAEGDCGPAGDVTLHTDSTTCALTVENAAAVGLPEKGFMTRVGEGCSDQIYLEGPVVHDGKTEKLTCGLADEPGAFRVSCFDGVSRNCSMTLTYRTTR